MNSAAYAKMIVNNFPQHVDSLLKDLKKLDKFFQKDDIKGFFLNILVSNKDKEEVLERMLTSVSPGVKNFLLFLAQRQRYDLIVDFYTLLNFEWMNKEGLIKGDLVFPFKPSKKSLKSALAIIKNVIGKDVDYNLIIDENIIGGFIFKSDKFMIDLSVKYQLEKLKQTVLE